MAKAMSRASRARRKNNNTMWIIGGVVAAAVLVLVLVFVNLSATAAPTPLPTALNAGRVLGKVNAPVTIDEYADFQCPICRRAEQTVRQIAPSYIDTGKAKIVYHNFAFIGNESVSAAEAAECANDQGKFWDYTYYLFDHQTGENVGAFSQNNLKQFATDLHLDITTFNACFDTGKYAQLIQQEKAEAQSRGITATPTFYFNGKMVQGLLDTTQFTAMIDSLLPKQ